MARNGPDAPLPFLLAGFEGTTIPGLLARRLREGRVAGAVLFSRNVEGPRQVRELCREIRAAGPKGGPPPLVAIDQEGGRVLRLRDPSFTPFPPARSYSLFCCRAGEAAEWTGRAIATELAAVGIGVNFAPVLDVDSNPANPVIGDRALSADPRTAAGLGVAFLRGTLSAGVVPVGKHFPGHGMTDADSHEELPVARSSRNTLLSRDLLPFRAAIRAGIPALMTAHVLYPAIDRENPATLSEKILRGLLRKDLRFRGVLFSDDLVMKAISGRMGIGEAAVRAVAAGCDAVLVCRGPDAQEEAIDSLSRGVRENPRLRAAASDATRRLLRLRGVSPPPGAPRPSLRSVGTRAHRDLARFLEARWEQTRQTCSDDRSGNTGAR